jgi:hypothetical protein
MDLRTYLHVSFSGAWRSLGLNEGVIFPHENPLCVPAMTSQAPGKECVRRDQGEEVVRVWTILNR